MTGFDETVPADDTDPDEDGTAARRNATENDPAASDPVPAERPEHDLAVPAVADDADPDEPGGDR